MKIDEIKDGTEYALTQTRSDPRRVKAIKVVTVDDRVYSMIKERYVTMQKRKVLVEFLDKTPDRWQAQKGTQATVEARTLLPWSEVGPGIRRRMEQQAKEEAIVAATDKRLKALLGRNYDGYVVARAGGAAIDLRGKSLDKMLELAEMGMNRIAQTRPAKKVKGGRVKK